MKPKSTATLKDWLNWCETQFIVHALREARGRIDRAAEILDVDASNLGKKLKRLEIDAKEYK